jgi:TetR/AcrR family transcriptional regulator, regulator of cefoperazone and chloramphenicol sensitivity
MSVGSNKRETTMKISRAATAKTRGKLLAAAAQIFAEKGFRDTTIAEISLRAGTNIAAVNYHFGSKKALYCESWRHAFAKALEAHPPDGGVAAEAPAEERLRGQVMALLRRVADKNNRDFWFIHREIANPTGLLDKVMRKELRPLQQQTERTVRELLGPWVAEREARFCEMGIISQCVNPMVVPHRFNRGGKRRDGPWRVEDIEAYARHVVTFSLAGIGAVRAAAEAQRDGRKAKPPGKEGKKPAGL